MKQSIPGFGSRLTGEGHVALGTDKHKFGVNALVSRNMPNHPDIPSFNSVGGGVDYTFK